MQVAGQHDAGFAFSPRAPGFSLIEGWVGLRAGPVLGETFLSLPGIEPTSLCRPSRSLMKKPHQYDVSSAEESCEVSQVALNSFGRYGRDCTLVRTCCTKKCSLYVMCVWISYNGQSCAVGQRMFETE